MRERGMRLGKGGAEVMRDGDEAGSFFQLIITLLMRGWIHCLPAYRSLLLLQYRRFAARNLIWRIWWERLIVFRTSDRCMLRSQALLDGYRKYVAWFIILAFSSCQKLTLLHAQVRRIAVLVDRHLRKLYRAPGFQT